MRRISCLFTLFVSISAPALATTVEVQVNQSAQTRSQQFSGDGSYQNKDYNWDLSYTHTTSESTVTDTTHDLVVGSGFSNKTWNATLDLNYSNTPEENLASSGPTVSLSYTYFFKSAVADSENEDAFRSSAKVLLELSTLGFEETFGTTSRRRGLNRPTTGNTTIQQKSVLLGARWRPWSWVQLKASATKYTYNKDVNLFLQYIESPIVARVSSGMSNALAGFYDTTRKVEFDFYFLDIWDLNISQSQSTVIADSSVSTTSAVNLGASLGLHWATTLGVKKVASSDAAISDVNSVTGRIDYFF